MPRENILTGTFGKFDFNAFGVTKNYKYYHYVHKII